MTLALLAAPAPGALPYGRGAWAGLRGLPPVALAPVLGFGAWGPVAAGGAAGGGPFRARAVAFGATAACSPLAALWALVGAGLVLAATGRRAWAAAAAAAPVSVLLWCFHAPSAYALFGPALPACAVCCRRSGAAGFGSVAAEQR